MHFFTRPDTRFLQETGSLSPACLSRFAASGGESAPPLLLANPVSKPGREPLRHLIVGSREGVQSQIHTLHVLNYADQATWSRLFTIPEPGILLTPKQGEVFSFLLRYRQPN